LTSYTPAQIATAYDSASLIAAGIDGGGEKLASVQFARYSATDIADFNTTFGVGSSATLVDVPLCGGASSDPNNGDVETTLDIELQMAAAPGASTILEYNAPNTSFACYDMMIQQIATDNRATSISTSWGLCEPYSPNSDSRDPAQHNAFLQMASQGQSFFAATGDDGALDCYTARWRSQRVLATPELAGRPGYDQLLFERQARSPGRLPRRRPQFRV
jgi:subtilase family serine protease